MTGVFTRNPDGTIVPGQIPDALSSMFKFPCFDLQAGVLRTRRLIVCGHDGNEELALANIMFGNDSSVMVDLSYFQESSGIAGVVSFPPGPGPLDLEINKFSRHTSHLVKYTHHPSGTCNFSKTGKVVTIKKQGVPLDRDVGHIFTFKVGGFGAFRPLKANYRGKKPTEKRAVITFGASAFQPEGAHLCEHKLAMGGIEVRGWWHSRAGLRRSFLHGRVPPRPIFPTVDRKGRQCMGILMAPRKSTPLDDMVLLLLVTSYPSLEKDNPGLSFIGGFDGQEKADDLANSTEFLAYLYPASEDPELLTERLGSLDLERRDMGEGKKE